MTLLRRLPTVLALFVFCFISYHSTVMLLVLFWFIFYSIRVKSLWYTRPLYWFTYNSCDLVFVYIWLFLGLTSCWKMSFFLVWFGSIRRRFWVCVFLVIYTYMCLFAFYWVKNSLVQGEITLIFFTVWFFFFLKRHRFSIELCCRSRHFHFTLLEIHFDTELKKTFESFRFLELPGVWGQAKTTLTCCLISCLFFQVNLKFELRVYRYL